jgi:3-oxoadipate enol-lactonase
VSAPLLLLHPLGVDHRFWETVLAHLPEHPAVVPDLPGHGQAGAEGAGSIAAMAARLASALADRGPYRVVGASLGGLVGQQLAATEPSLVDSLVLVDTVAAYPAGWRESWAERARTARNDGMAPLVGPTLALWFTPAALQADGPTVRAMRRLLADAAPEGYATTCEALADADLRADLHRITAPTLVACGEHDAQAFLDGALELRDAIPDARLHWLPGGHAAAIEHPEHFAGVLDGFRSGSRTG